MKKRTYKGLEIPHGGGSRPLFILKLSGITDGITMQNLMKVGPKGQVVIPQEFRIKMNITPGSFVLFKEEKGRLYIRKVEKTEEVFARIAKSGKSVDLGPHEAYEGSVRR